MGIIADIMSAPYMLFRTFTGREFSTPTPPPPPTALGVPPQPAPVPTIGAGAVSTVGPFQPTGQPVTGDATIETFLSNNLQGRFLSTGRLEVFLSQEMPAEFRVRAAQGRFNFIQIDIPMPDSRFTGLPSAGIGRRLLLTFGSDSTRQLAFNGRVLFNMGNGIDFYRFI